MAVRKVPNTLMGPARKLTKKEHEPKNVSKKVSKNVSKKVSKKAPKIGKSEVKYIPHAQGHLYKVWLRGTYVLQVTFFRGKERTLAIAEEILGALLRGASTEQALDLRQMLYLRASRQPMTHEWDPRILADHDAATVGKREWRGEVSPRHSRVVRFA